MWYRKPGSDVTAVVLTIGEPTTQKAIESLRRQTAPVHDIIVVSDSRPFHKALNVGAGRVTTPFFVQVDADMVLDPHCIATLRKAMAPDVGISVGRLRDSIMGQVVGIKLFRTECFASAQFRDSISPDTDFVDEIARTGWRTIYVGSRRGAATIQWKTLGEHRPDYTAVYTYRKLLMEGRRYRYRSSVGGFAWHLCRLEQSRHPSAFVAQIAFARGFFLEADHDALGRSENDDECARVQAFLNAKPVLGARIAEDAPLEESAFRDRFRACYRIGHTAYHANDPDAFRNWMTKLISRADDPTTCISKLALCQGLLSASANDHAIGSAYQLVSAFFAAGSRPLDATPSSAPADIQHLAQDDLSLEEITSYAASIGLRRFALTPPSGAQYVIEPEEDTFRRTGATVTGTLDIKGRPRIDLPLHLFGHIICTDPERLGGLAWCLDLMKRGYLFVHAPSPLGVYRVSVPRLLGRNLLERCGWRSAAPPSGTTRRALARMTGSQRPTYQPNPDCVLMVTENLVRGGSERQMVAVAHGLLGRGHDVKVLSLSRLASGVASFETELAGLGIIAEYAPDHGVLERARMRAVLHHIRTTDRPVLPKWLAGRISTIAEAIARHHPAVVHAWLDGPGVAAALAGCMLGTPRIVIQQGGMAVVRRGFRASDMLRQAYRALAMNPAVAILNNSAAGARDNALWLGLPPDKIGVLHNGYLPQSARMPSPDMVARYRTSMGLPEGMAVVGTIMRFVPEKDPALWLDAAAEIAKKRPDVHFLIGGYGSLEEIVRKRIQALGLSGRVLLAGTVEDAGLAYSVMDVVLLSSATEGIPNVMIEAQAVGRGVVAPDVGGTRESVLEGRTGLIVRPRSAEGLARAVLTMLDDVDWRRRIQIEGPEFVARRFGLERMVSETLDCYGRAAHAKPDAAP